MREAVTQGDIPVVIDTSGDLPDLAASILNAHTVDSQIVDCGAEPPPLWNLTEPDRGISREEGAKLPTPAAEDANCGAFLDDRSQFGPDDGDDEKAGRMVTP